MSDNTEKDNKQLGSNIISILIIIGIFIMFIIISFFIKDYKLQIAYWSVVGLLTLTLINLYMSIGYYIKLREDPGQPGPRGPKGEKGPIGDPGKCTFSEKCGISDCEDKILALTDEYYPDISRACIKNNNKCSNEELELAKPISKQVDRLIEQCKKSNRAESDFLRKIRPLIANLEKK